ncbi:hypothetical protein EDB83DRAFT_2323661 [Lactarius deliciosus]|nr:hypothetical protein EDB83DRAFT_2323661 [Lactarius deliciosus]
MRGKDGVGGQLTLVRPCARCRGVGLSQTREERGGVLLLIGGGREKRGKRRGKEGDGLFQTPWRKQNVPATSAGTLGHARAHSTFHSLVQRASPPPHPRRPPISAAVPIRVERRKRSGRRPSPASRAAPDARRQGYIRKGGAQALLFPHRRPSVGGCTRASPLLIPCPRHPVRAERRRTRARRSPSPGPSPSPTSRRPSPLPPPLPLSAPPIRTEGVRMRAPTTALFLSSRPLPSHSHEGTPPPPPFPIRTEGVMLPPLPVAPGPSLSPSATYAAPLPVPPGPSPSPLTTMGTRGHAILGPTLPHSRGREKYEGMPPRTRGKGVREVTSPPAPSFPVALGPSPSPLPRCPVRAARRHATRARGPTFPHSHDRGDRIPPPPLPIWPRRPVCEGTPPPAPPFPLATPRGTHGKTRGQAAPSRGAPFAWEGTHEAKPSPPPHVSRRRAGAVTVRPCSPRPPRFRVP